MASYSLNSAALRSACLIILLGWNTKASAACTQFATNGSSGAYYNIHRFYDFRDLVLTDDTPLLPTAFEDGAKHLSAVTWSSDWKAISWFRPSSKPENSDMQYVSSDVSIGHDSTTSQDSSSYLSLIANRLANGTQLATELDYTEHNVTHASIRVMARVHGAGGAVAGIFTYFDDTTESDIEIRTRDPPTEVHLSNQPTTDLVTTEAIPGATFNKPVPDYREWNVYRLDWVPGRSAWYVNGVDSASTNVNVPDTPSTIILNMWSNGGDFSGRMQPGSEAWFDIQWIELLYNATDVALIMEAGDICSVEYTPGTPAPLAGVNVQRSTRSGASRKDGPWTIGARVTIALLICSLLF